MRPPTSAVISGLRVVAGVGSDDKAALVRDYGANAVINFRGEDLRNWIKTIPSGEGLYDVGDGIFEQMARLMN